MVLEKTPAVLSIGRRCMVDGYSFHWQKFKNPYLISPNGYKIELEVENFCPYLREYYATAPAVEQEEQEVVEQPRVDQPAVAQPDAGQSIVQEPEAHDSLEEPEAQDLLKRSKENKLTAKELLVLQESRSLKHLLCHMPQNPFCDTCR